MSEYTREDFSVAIAQRRLLEAVAAYGCDLPPEGQATVLSAFASGLVASCGRLGPGDDDAVAIYAGLGELLVAVAHERIDAAMEGIV